MLSEIADAEIAVMNYLCVLAGTQGAESGRGLLSRYCRTDLFWAVMSSLAVADSIWVISIFLFPLSFCHYPIILKKSDRLWQVVPAAEEHPHFTSWKIFLGNIFLPNWYLLNILPEMIFRTLIFLPPAEFQYKPSFAPTRFTGKWNV